MRSWLRAWSDSVRAWRVRAAGGFPIPLTADRVPVIRATLPGREPLDFILDTACTSTLFHSGAVMHLKWEPPGADDSVDDGRTRVIPLGRLALPSWRIGPLALTGVEALVFDLGEVLGALERPALGGILGQDALRRLVSVIDVAHATWWVIRRDAWETVRARLHRASDWHPLEVEWDELGHPTIRVEVRGVGAVPMTVDTGATSSLIASSLARDLGLAREGTIVHRTIGGEYEAPAFTMPGILLAGREIAFTRTAGTDEARSTLGFDHLRDFLFALDGPGGRIWLAAP